MSDQVEHPAHYNSGRIEVIEFLEDQKLNFHRANAIKYIARAGKKDPNKEIEDLEKAIWYLARDIELLKSQKEERSAIRPNDMNCVDRVITSAIPSGMGVMASYLPPGTVVNI